MTRIETPNRFAPSVAQIEAFNRLPARPLALLLQYSAAPHASHAAVQRELAALAAAHDGKLIWAGRRQQLLIGEASSCEALGLFRFGTPNAAAAFVEMLVASATGEHLALLQVQVLTPTPRALTLLSAVLARLLPKWPFDDSIEDSEDPGIGVSGVMPSRAAAQELKAHPVQDRPVVMVNWLKFRPRADYPAGTPPASGRTAYHRYGKVALITTHSLGAKILGAGRYLLTLVGNGGDPAPKLWDEFVLMQYPGRAAFMRMTALKRYRRALPHREAGLTEHGQGLLVTEPDAEFIWRR